MVERDDIAQSLVETIQHILDQADLIPTKEKNTYVIGRSIGAITAAIDRMECRVNEIRRTVDIMAGKPAVPDESASSAN